jgi:iron complex transport system substrate-binding protein
MNDAPDHYLVRPDQPIDHPPQRVVSLVPAMTEALFALDLGRAVVGVTDACRFPAQAAQRTVVGTPHTPDVERIQALGPDFLICDPELTAIETMDALRHMTTVYPVHPTTVRDAFNVLWNLMHIFDHGTVIEGIRSIEWTCDWLERMAAQNSEPPAVLLVLAGPRLSTIPANTFASDMIRLCGGINVVADVGGEHMLERTEPMASRLLPLNDASIEVLDPDTVWIATRAGEPNPTLFGHIAAKAMRAAQTNHIYFVDSTLLFWYGTRMGLAFQVLPAVTGLGNY